MHVHFLLQIGEKRKTMKLELGIKCSCPMMTQMTQHPMMTKRTMMIVMKIMKRSAR